MSTSSESAPVTVERVVAVAEEIAAAGRKPTLMSVRDALGGRGGQATLVEGLKIWRQRNGLAPTPDVEERPAVDGAALGAVVELVRDEHARFREMQNDLRASTERSLIELKDNQARYAQIWQQYDARLQSQIAREREFHDELKVAINEKEQQHREHLERAQEQWRADLAAKEQLHRQDLERTQNQWRDELRRSRMTMAVVGLTVVVILVTGGWVMMREGGRAPLPGPIAEAKATPVPVPVPVPVPPIQAVPVLPPVPSATGGEPTRPATAAASP